VSKEQTTKDVKTHRASSSFIKKSVNREITITNDDQEEIKKEMKKHELIQTSRAAPVIIATTEDE